jgi:hypothetical protein
LHISSRDPVFVTVYLQSNAFNATAVVNLQPTVVPNERYCTPVVRFNGQTLTIADNVALRPETAGFSFVAVFRQANTNTMNLLTRSNVQSFDYSLTVGTQVKSLSQTGGSQRSQTTRSMSDTTKFYVSSGCNSLLRFVAS